MKKIIVLGNSLAGVTAIHEIRKNDPAAEFTLFTLGEELPAYRHLFADFIARDISLDDVYVHPEKYYQNFPVNIVRDKKIARVNFRKSKVVMDDKQSFDYDYLIIADTEVNKFPDIKGVQRAGVFGLRSFAQIHEIFTAAPLWETVVVQADNISGIRVAAALQKRGKEVVVLLTSGDILPGMADVQTAGLIKQILSEQGMRFIEQNSIAEILGDSDVKAIRLKSGKVIGCQAVILGEAKVELKLFRDSELNFMDRVLVTPHLQTNVPNVFAVDAAAEWGQDDLTEAYDSFEEVRIQQGQVVARAINGEEQVLQLPVPLVRWKLKEDSWQWIGMTSESAQITGLTIDLQAQRYWRIFVQDEVLVGAVLNNQPARAESIRAAIASRARLSDIADADLQDWLSSNRYTQPVTAAAPLPDSSAVLDPQPDPGLKADLS